MSNLSLFRRNKGHSPFVQHWIEENNNSATMVAVFGSAITLKRIFDCLKDNCGQSEVNMECDPKLIQMQALGNESVSVISIDLFPKSLEFYSCPLGLKLGIIFSGITGFLKQGLKNDQVSILYSNGSRECLFVLEDGARTSIFQMRLKIFENSSLIISEGDYPIVATIPSNTFARIFKDFKGCVSDITINVSENGIFSFVGSGNYGSIQIVCDDIITEKYSEFTSTFSCAYLFNFSKSVIILNSSVLKMKFGPDLPVMCSFGIDNEVGKVNYFLAYKMVNQ